MKVAVAASERGDKRARPHTPWPLVHPPPEVAPKPTRKPPVPMRRRLFDTVCTIASWVTKAWSSGAARRPTVKAAAWAVSESR